MRPTPISFFISLTICAILAACSSNGSDSPQPTGDTITTKASLLTLIDNGEFIYATIANPWDSSAAPLQKLILIDKNYNIPTDIPTGTIVRIPVENSLVLSSVHAGAIKEIGAIKSITGICDTRFFKIPEIAQGLSSGKIMDIGNSMSPSAEQIALLAPDAILISPYQNSNSTGFAATGSPVIMCADYMEPTPLGRAEWIKLLGILYGKREEADSIFLHVTASYDEIRQKALTITHKPTVISEMVTDGVWYVPGGKSYMARIFQDAGALYPWSDTQSPGSLPLDFAAVYEQAHDADIWLVKMLCDATLEDIKSAYPLNDRFKAFNNGGIYSCNSAKTTFYEDFPFHPEKLLGELYKIFHPSEGDTLKYYQKVDK